MDWLIVVSSSAPGPEITTALVAFRVPSNRARVQHFQSVLQKKDSIPVLSSQKLPELPIESKRNFCGGL
jgi:hypothetical protein